MTAKQWLMRARKLECRIASLEAAKQRAYDRAVSTTSRPREVCVIGGGSSDKAESYVIVAESVQAQEDKLNRIRTEILDAISKVEDNRYSTLLTEYYVNGRTWEQVAKSVSRVKRKYSTVYVRKELHAQALKEIAQYLVYHAITT